MQQLDIQLGGLNTNPSPFKTKPGTLSKAENINIDAPNQYTARRGINIYGDLIAGNVPYGIDEYKDRIIAFVENKAYYDSDNAGTWAAYQSGGSDLTATVVDTTIGRRTVQNNGSLFFNSTNGAYKIDALTADPILAGGIKAIGADWALAGSSNSWFTPDNQVAYRVVWGLTDANSVVTLGAPSERIEVINSSTGGSGDDVNLTIYIPDGVTTSHFYQVYRSGLSSSDEIVANDELQLVYEDFPTSAEIAAGELTFTDNTPDALRGATIYTAATQEGIQNANDVPPVAKDVTAYKGYALWANTSTRHRKYLTLLAVGEDSGVGIGDIVTIAGVAFTGAASQDHTAGEFAIVTSGTAAENIADTAKSLAQVINRYSSNTETYAYYVSTYDALPGRLLIERRNMTDASFNISFTNATTDDHSKAWNPTLTSAITSDNEVKINRIYISKYNQYDAVPLASYIDVGSGNSEIRRIIALRDSVFIFKDSGKVFRLVGDVKENFAVSLFDNTVTIINPRSAVPFANQIYMMSDQGVVAVSDAGVAIKSWDIQKDIIEVSKISSFITYGGATAYERENKYILHTGFLNSDGNYHSYVYNTLTNTWTTWTWGASRRVMNGFVRNSENKFYAIAESLVYVLEENVTGTDYLDYADYYLTKTIVSSSGTSVVVNLASGAGVGHYLLQGTNCSKITAINYGTNTITVSDTLTWSNTTCYTGSPMDINIKFLPLYADNPGMMKRFREVFVTAEWRVPEMTIAFTNSFDDTEVTADLSTTETSMEVPTSYRCYVPLNLQRALWEDIELRIDTAFMQLKINGLSVHFDETDERFTQ